MTNTNELSETDGKNLTNWKDVGELSPNPGERVIISDDDLIRTVKERTGYPTFDSSIIEDLPLDEILSELFDGLEGINNYLGFASDTYGGVTGPTFEVDEKEYLGNAVSMSSNLKGFARLLQEDGVGRAFLRYVRGDIPSSYDSSISRERHRLGNNLDDVVCRMAREFSRPCDTHDFFDMTDIHQDAGGREGRQVLLLTEPRLRSTSLSGVYRPEDVVREATDYSRATKIIKKAEPNTVILDMNYLGPIHHRAREKLRRGSTFNGEFETDLNHRRFYTDFTDDDLKPPADNMTKGGVMLGEILDREAIPFSHWTSDYGHSARAMQMGYALGTIQQEDVESLVDNIRKNREDKSIHHSHSGRLITGSKLRHGNGSDPRPTGQYIDRVIDIAGRHQRIARR